jgi:ubiquinone/menaquinone biosynthesis C-methylase UbiE
MTLETNHDATPPTQDAAAGAAAYTKFVLSIYDPLVFKFENAFVWKCPTRLLLDHYNRYVSSNHLDVGVGTGYLLDNCRFPADDPKVALMDLNPNSLQFTAARIRRYRPTTYLANVLEPIKYELPAFDSVGLNYLLQCLPGSMSDKGRVFSNLKPFMNPGGVLFGTTILGQGVEFNSLGRLFMGLYNSRRILNNRNDNLADLERNLERNFAQYSLHTVGCVAFFVGRA